MEGGQSELSADEESRPIAVGSSVRDLKPKDQRLDPGQNVAEILYAHDIGSLPEFSGRDVFCFENSSEKAGRKLRERRFTSLITVMKTPTTRTIRPSAAALAAVAALLLAACSAPAAGRSPGRRVILFIDQSASIDRDQRREWQNDADSLVRGIRDGWSVSIYGIHDHTLESAPLFEVDIPAVSSDGTFRTAACRNAAIQTARQGALAAVEKALNTGGAARTDIFSALDRVHPDPRSRPTTIVFFSDMLNSTPELNMEHPGSVTLQNVGALIPSLARRHLWRKDSLAGTEVYCVLNSIEIGRSGPAVDRRVQQVFYENLFGALSAKLIRYETTLGGDNAAR